MGHAHIVWVRLSAARIAVRALNCITSHVAEPVGVWNGLYMRAGFETKQFIKFMCVHFGRIMNRDRICIEFQPENFAWINFINISCSVVISRSTGVY